MIDMNMDIESIMNECDYIAEVKGEAEMGYERSNIAAKNTNSHAIGSDYGKISKEFRHTPDYQTNDRLKPMKNADDYRRRAKNTEEFKKLAKKADESDAKYKEYNKKKYAGYNSKHESLSIFDDLLDLV